MNNNNCRQNMQQKNSQRVWEDDTLMTAFPHKVSVVMAYVPFQLDGEVYSCEKGLMQGTMFPVLDKPFMMGCCKC